MRQLLTAINHAKDNLDREMLHKNLKEFTREEYAVLYLEVQTLIDKAEEFRKITDNNLVD